MSHRPTPGAPVLAGTPVTLCTCGEKIVQRDGEWEHFGVDTPYEGMEIAGPATATHRPMTEAEFDAQPLGGGLSREAAGCEPIVPPTGLLDDRGCLLFTLARPATAWPPLGAEFGCPSNDGADWFTLGTLIGGEVQPDGRLRIAVRLAPRVSVDAS